MSNVTILLLHYICNLQLYPYKNYLSVQKCLLHLYLTVYKSYMEERLKLFLAMEGLSPSQFADKLGVQRSGVSHLLSGRNKPSFEFISRMLVTFPKINPDWLITGNGKAYRDFSTQIAESDSPTYQQTEANPGNAFDAQLEDDSITGNEPELFSGKDLSKSDHRQFTDTPVTPSQTALAAQDPPAPAQPEVIRQSSVPQQVNAPQPQKYPSENRLKHPASAGRPAKQIAQITILYTDGTYEVR